MIVLGHEPYQAVLTGGFAKDVYCYLILVCFLVTLVPHLPSGSDMTECSIKRKKESMMAQWLVHWP